MPPPKELRFLRVHQVYQLGAEETYHSKKVGNFATSIPTWIIQDGPGYAVTSTPQWFPRTVFCPLWVGCNSTACCLHSGTQAE